MALLEAENLSISFGGLKAVDNFRISTEKGQLYGLTGPNRTGKTTILNLLINVYKPNVGSIELTRINITGRKAMEINQVGIARAFQDIRLFKDLSVPDNVRAGLHSHYRCPTTAGIFCFPNYFKVEEQMDGKAMELLRVFGLDEECNYKTPNLPYGEQRKLEIARVPATEPKLLLLDKSAAGMDPSETAELMDTIHFVRSNFGMTILLIEHDMKLVSGIYEELIVPNFGQILCQGETGTVLHNPEVVKAYPGE